MKRTLEDMIDCQEKKKSKRRQEIVEIEKDLAIKYKEDEKCINEMIAKVQEELKGLQEKKDIIESQKKTNHSVPKCSFLKMICKVLNHPDGYFFDPDDEQIYALEYFLTEKEDSNDVDYLEYIDNLKLEGLDDSEIHGFMLFLKDNIIMKQETATFTLKGRIKGYKGDATKFKHDGEPPTIKNSGAEPYNSNCWDDIYQDEIPLREDDIYQDEIPLREDIDWPDSDSTMASAKLYKDVIVLLKKV
jgi:hypothetical protein